MDGANIDEWNATKQTYANATIEYMDTAPTGDNTSGGQVWKCQIRTYDLEYEDALNGTESVRVVTIEGTGGSRPEEKIEEEVPEEEKGFIGKLIDEITQSELAQEGRRKLNYVLTGLYVFNLGLLENPWMFTVFWILILLLLIEIYRNREKWRKYWEKKIKKEKKVVKETIKKEFGQRR